MLEVENCYGKKSRTEVFVIGQQEVVAFSWGGMNHYTEEEWRWLYSHSRCGRISHVRNSQSMGISVSGVLMELFGANVTEIEYFMDESIRK